MSYVWCRWIADVLRAEGCKVREYDGWKDRGRPSSTGSFNPYAVLHHHTGTKTSYSNPAPTLSTCVHGRSDLPGPLCQVMIAYDGVCHVIAAGRANHAGECNGNGPTSSGDGNAQMIGFEVDYSGSQPVSPEQADAVIRATAAVLRKLGRDASYCRGHKETSTTGKWDPGRNGSGSSAYNMGEVRGYVADRLAGGGEDDVSAWASITLTADQSIGPGAKEVIGFDHEASDSDGMHSESSWVAALRPPAGGYTRGHFYAWLNVTGGTPGERVRVRLLVSPVDESNADSTSGATDLTFGANGGVCGSLDVLLGCGNDRRYRVQVENLDTQAVTVQNGSLLRAIVFKG